MSSSLFGGNLVGTLPGGVVVNNSGQSVYSIPISIPGGTGGVQPELSLNYSSDGHNGVLGTGWSLGGLYSINRIGKMLARDGVAESLKYDSTDNYAFDGMRLIEYPAGSSSSVRAFKTELESFNIIEAHEWADGFIDYWQVKTKSGLTLYFGSDREENNSRIDLSWVPITWNVSKVVDTAGNYMEVYYEKFNEGNDQNNTVPQKIIYTGNENVGLEPYVSIQFIYEDRDDFFPKYANRELIQSAKRLKHILVCEGTGNVDSFEDSRVHDRYTINYGYFESNGDSKVDSIQAFHRGNSGLESLPATTFSYDDSGEIQTSQLTGANTKVCDAEWMSFGISSVKTGDFNGDGQTDILQAGEGVFLRSNEGSGWTKVAGPSFNWGDYSGSPEKAEAQLSRIKLGDFNGDGLTDIYYIHGHGTLDEILADLNYFEDKCDFSSYDWGISFDSGGIFSYGWGISFDSGGISSDCIISSYYKNIYDSFEEGDEKDRIYLSNGDGTYELMGGIQSGHVRFDASVETSKFAGNRLQVLDFNSDGLADIYYVNDSSDFSVYLNDGNGGFSETNVNFDPSTVLDPYAASLYLYEKDEDPDDQYLSLGRNKFGDFNGDGFQDLYVAVGYGWLLNKQDYILLLGPEGIKGVWQGIYSRIVLGESEDDLEECVPASYGRINILDWNSDGLSDIYYVESGVDSIYLNNGTKTIDKFTRYDGADTPIDIVDHYGLEPDGVNSLSFNDFNGDGILDVMRMRANDVDITEVLDSPFNLFSTANADISLSKGIELYCQKTIQTPFPSNDLSKTLARLRQGDFNGDGAVELYYIKGDYSYEEDALITLEFPHKKLESVTNGLGEKTLIRYGYMTDDSLYTKGTGAVYPIKDVQFPAILVSEVGKDYGKQGESTDADDLYWSTYQYGAARVDCSGRGFLGYGQFISFNQDTGVMSYEFVEQSFPMMNMPKQKEVYYVPDGDVGSKILTSKITNALVFDEVIDAQGQETGSVFPMITESKECKYKFRTTPDSGNESSVENYKTYESTIQTFFDSQKTRSQPYTRLPDGFFPDTDSFTNAQYGDDDEDNYKNRPFVGHLNYSEIDDLSFPHLIKYGNVTKTKTLTDANTFTQVENTYGGSDEDKRLGRLTYSKSILQGSVEGNIEQETRESSFSYYLGTGLLHTETIEPSDSVYRKLTTYTRDATGNVTEQWVEGGSGDSYLSKRLVVRNLSYDSTYRFPQATENTLGHKEYRRYDLFSGQVKYHRGPNGLETTYEYDAMGRLAATYALQSGEWSTSSTSWVGESYVSPEASNFTYIPVEACYQVTTEARAAPSATVYYDRLGRQLLSAKENGQGRTVYEWSYYDRYGRGVASSKPSFSITPAYFSYKTFDDLGRVSTTRLPNGSGNSYSYEGRKSTVIENAFSDNTLEVRKKKSIEETDAQGRTKYVYNPHPEILGQTFKAIEYVYDASGNIYKTKQYDTEGSLIGETIMEYDILGNKTYMKDIDMGEWSYNYNALGELLWQEDANGNITRNEYDQLGRITRRITSDQDPFEKEVTDFSYYDKSELQMGAWLGALHRETVYENGSYTKIRYQKGHFFDYLGRKFLELQYLDEKYYYTHTQYDELGRLSDIAYYWRPKGLTSNYVDKSYLWNSYGLHYDYNDDSIMTEISDTNDRVWFYDPIYNEQGQLTSHGLGDFYKGIERVYRYNELDNLLERITTTTSSGDLLQDEEYEYGNMGNLLYREDHVNGAQSELFTYDNLARLRFINEEEMIQYDDIGNILKKRLTPTGSWSDNFQYHSQKLHAVTQAMGYHMRYDNNGNMNYRNLESSGDSSIHYTGFNKAYSLFSGSKGVLFDYDSSHNRIIRTDVRNTNEAYSKKLYIGGGMEQLWEKDNDDEWELESTRITISGAGGMLGVYEIDASASSTADIKRHLSLTDHLGSVVALIDMDSDEFASEANITRMSYDAWGNRRSASDWNQLISDFSSDVTDRGFTGHEMLDSLGLVHMNGRIYDSLIGRFLSADPNLQFPNNLQSYNRYSYVLNNPLTFTDPSGYFIPILVGILCHVIGLDLWVTAIIMGLTVFVQTLAQGGTFKDALKNGIIAGVSTYVAGKIGESFNGMYKDFNPKLESFGKYAAKKGLNFGIEVSRAFAHGMTQGAITEISGGEFEHGFLAGATSSAVGSFQNSQFSSKLMGIPSEDMEWNLVTARTAVAAIAGGTASEIGGGKFSDGAYTAAIVHLFNAEEIHKRRDFEPGQILIEEMSIRINRHGMGPSVDAKIAATLDMIKALSNYPGLTFPTGVGSQILVKTGTAVIDASAWLGGMSLPGYGSAAENIMNGFLKNVNSMAPFEAYTSFSYKVYVGQDSYFFGFVKIDRWASGGSYSNVRVGGCDKIFGTKTAAYDAAFEQIKSQISVAQNNIVSRILKRKSE